VDYEEAKRLASSADVEHRRALAADPAVAPELLYYLSRDDSPLVRLEVAGNPMAPREADLLLARDAEDEIRARVGQKLGEARPAGAAPLSARKQAITVQVAETLAGDDAGQVRVAVAEALKASADAPAHVIQQLARDDEISVAAPVLQHSPVLGDGDLIEVAESGRVKGVLNAIAKRRNVSSGVSEIVVNRAIASPDEASAVGDLLANDTAKIAGRTMDKIIDVAPEQGDWHQPLAARKDLTGEHLARVAAIPSETIAETMSSRSDLDPKSMAALSTMVAKRMAELTKKRDEEAAAARPPAADAFLNAVLKGGKVGPVCAAIALRAGIPTEVTMRILTSKNAKAVTSLAWKAGLSAQQAQALQVNIGGISAAKALAPTPTGSYALATADMDWQLGLFVADRARTQAAASPAIPSPPNPF